MKKQAWAWVLAAGLMMGGGSCGRKERPFRIELLKYVENSYTRSFEDSLRKGLAEDGLAEGRDYVLRSRSAQGDMSTLALLVDAAENARADLLITFQSPTLYAAIQRAPHVNKIFTLLQNPFILGAGESDEDHLPHLTGFYLVPPYEELLDLIGECRPAIHALGVIYDSGNEDSVNRKDELVRQAAERSLEVKAVAYTAQNEITLAVDTLLNGGPDAVLHLQDPAQDATFPVLYKAASRRRIPVFSLVAHMEKIGAAITCTTDREEIGARFARMVVRIVRGEDPSRMPFENDRSLRKRTGYNRTVALDIGMTLPESLVPGAE